VKKNV